MIYDIFVVFLQIKQQLTLYFLLNTDLNMKCSIAFM